jgi:sporulation protein YlmC with PRC-barrel domain
MRLSTVLGLPVQTESGRQLGVVRDVRAQLTPRTLRVTGVIVGATGLLERLGMIPLIPRKPSSHVVDWDDVIRADRRGIVIRDHAAPN